ncbi:hypothetical protein HDU76_006055 [Blyttiomyces sp. JEL0837]|nr:hypothetical protein HDU76_006055 [Blyttiomyces sp. JEL0837]
MTSSSGVSERLQQAKDRLHRCTDDISNVKDSSAHNKADDLVQSAGADIDLFEQTFENLVSGLEPSIADRIARSLRAHIKDFSLKVDGSVRRELDKLVGFVTDEVQPLLDGRDDNADETVGQIKASLTSMAKDKLDIVGLFEESLKEFQSTLVKHTSALYEQFLDTAGNAIYSKFEPRLNHTLEELESIPKSSVVTSSNGVPSAVAATPPPVASAQPPQPAPRPQPPATAPRPMSQPASKDPQQPPPITLVKPRPVTVASYDTPLAEQDNHAAHDSDAGKPKAVQSRNNALFNDLNRMLAGPPPKMPQRKAEEQEGEEVIEEAAPHIEVVEASPVKVMDVQTPAAQPASETSEPPPPTPSPATAAAATSAASLSVEASHPPATSPSKPAAPPQMAVSPSQDKKKGGLMGMLSHLTKSRPKAARKGSNRKEDEGEEEASGAPSESAHSVSNENESQSSVNASDVSAAPTPSQPHAVEDKPVAKEDHLRSTESLGPPPVVPRKPTTSSVHGSRQSLAMDEARHNEDNRTSVHSEDVRHSVDMDDSQHSVNAGADVPPRPMPRPRPVPAPVPAPAPVAPPRRSVVYEDTVQPVQPVTEESGEPAVRSSTDDLSGAPPPRPRPAPRPMSSGTAPDVPERSPIATTAEGARPNSSYSTTSAAEGSADDLSATEGVPPAVTGEDDQPVAPPKPRKIPGIFSNQSGHGAMAALASAMKSRGAPPPRPAKPSMSTSAEEGLAAEQPSQAEEATSATREALEAVPVMPRPPPPAESESEHHTEYIIPQSSLNIKKKENSVSGDDKAIEKHALDWMNQHLASKDIHIDNLYSSLGDGLNLIYALEDCTGGSIGKYNKRAMLPVHKIDNIAVALNFLQKNGINTHFLSPQDVMNEDKSKILTLFNYIVKKF